MNWTTLLAEKRIASEPTSKPEIDNLRTLVDRCFADMRVTALSDEQRFIIAYDAARSLATIIIRACGYRPKKFGGHANTFLALGAADSCFAKAADYFDVCRAKRNSAEYDFAGGISKSDADDISIQVRQFRAAVEKWIKDRHPTLA